MFDEWLTSELCGYQGEMIAVVTDLDQFARVEGRLVLVQPAYLALAISDRLIFIRAEHVVAIDVPNTDDTGEETTQP